MATEAPTKEGPIYDLVLLLSPEAEDSQRSKILADVQSAISGAGGSIERDDDWGRRPMAYEIRHQPEAEYHLLQFRAPPTLIEELSHTLRITDGVIRFRVIKVRPGTPPAPSSPPPVVVAAASSGHTGTSAGPTAGSSSSSPEASAPEASAEGSYEASPEADAEGPAAASEGPAEEAGPEAPAEESGSEDPAES